MGVFGSLFGWCPFHGESDGRWGRAERADPGIFLRPTHFNRAAGASERLAGRRDAGSRGQSGSTESDEARTSTRLPTAPGKVDNDQARNNQTTTRKKAPRGRGQVLQSHGHSAAWQIHPRALRQVEAKRGQRASVTPNGNDKIERLPKQDRSGRDRPVCLRAREGNSRILFAAICQVDSAEGRYATMHNDKTRKPLVLPRRESTVRFEAVVTRYKSSSCGDQIYDSNGETGPG